LESSQFRRSLATHGASWLPEARQDLPPSRIGGLTGSAHRVVVSFVAPRVRMSANQLAVATCAILAPPARARIVLVVGNTTALTSQHIVLNCFCTNAPHEVEVVVLCCCERTGCSAEHMHTAGHALYKTM